MPSLWWATAGEWLILTSVLNSCSFNLDSGQETCIPPNSTLVTDPTDTWLREAQDAEAEEAA
jgi:hypothetical protein